MCLNTKVKFRNICYYVIRNKPVRSGIALETSIVINSVFVALKIFFFAVRIVYRNLNSEFQYTTEEHYNNISSRYVMTGTTVREYISLYCLLKKLYKVSVLTVVITFPYVLGKLISYFRILFAF
jgi:hypothetical protein